MSTFPAKSELETLVRRALGEATRLGASGADAAVSVDSGLSVTVRLGEVETLEHHRDRGLGITVYLGQRKGTATTGDLGWPAVAETVAKAVSMARFAAEDPFAGLPDPADLADGAGLDLDLDHPWPLEVDQAIEIARASEAAALAVDSRITNSEGASLATQRGIKVYGNTLGFIGGEPSTYYSQSCVVVASQDQAMERDYWYTVGRAAADLESPEAVGRVAAERTVRRLGARRLATARAPVLFVPEMARGLFGHFLGAIRGSSQYRRSSFLLDAAGTAVFPAFMQIDERPHLRRGLGSAAFDAEGCRTADRSLVKDGVLTGYVLNSYAARKLNLRTTGNAGGVHNLTVASGTDDFAALLGKMRRGLVVTELMGQGVNGVTGDYSRGAAGFWVEAGELAYPVHEITIAGNLRDMLKGIVAVGSDVDRRGALVTGSVLLEEMTIAGE
jgi:PmbA protein